MPVTLSPDSCNAIPEMAMAECGIAAYVSACGKEGAGHAPMTQSGKKRWKRSFVSIASDHPAIFGRTYDSAWERMPSVACASTGKERHRQRQITKRICGMFWLYSNMGA